jgi:hypothetical protein
MFKLELIMTIEMIIGAAVVVLLVAMYFKHRAKPVDMDHKAPNVHNVQMEGKVGPATAADKPAEPAKKAPAKAKAKPVKATAAAKPAAKKVPLSRMNKEDLLAHAKKQGVKVDDSMTKKQILEELKK